MKNKFYTSLLLGVGLAVLATSSYAKPAHAAHKKHASAIAKSGKKHGATPAKHGATPAKHAAPKQRALSGITPVKHTVSRQHRLHGVISDLKNAHKRHDVHHGQKRQFGKKKLPSPGRTPLEKILPPLTVSIPHLPSHNEFIKPEVEATETNTRIHSFIPSERQDQTIDRSSADDGPHDYTTTHGIITSSLADAGLEAGLSEELVNQLTHIFAWDIDFATNLHVGDEFTVMYGSNGVGEEHIIAAEFVTEGRVLTAVRYEDEEGNVNYYTPEGKAMRKAFLSTPVDYARITSHFDAHRRHPILNRIRAHKGVDYAARTGTPVKATGDGTIAFMGRKGGYGQVIIIQHGERFETLYAHLSDFNSHLLEGDTVGQGDIIGYVGQTGLATGPHLHYEFRVDGMHRNPEISGSGSRNDMALNSVSLQDFKMQTRAIVAQLYSAKAQSLFAKNQEQLR
ncbi:MAG: peptidoglycan DD-metalloendopeptidase family protein [Methylovulum sp.]|uniref:M23 family metallopeptidase n=1 Tax=Methylovulum sp. TaxID=1916980 RepID=UPI00260E8FC0|nr:peptidoglycan DD-metalloendopeptidase family protein [Methylovulum sp.]MDD2723795.1 peptidoglycan DD-metalloendopeptidase family protein [Methylovulum sp.]MDD5123652.1 peptidoglycan DD-metalloendopeptidase family protein [Methylovulum sp.]